MTIYLRQGTASQEVPLGPFLDDGDGNTPEAGLTIGNTDIKLWMAGATALANKNSGGATHMLMPLPLIAILRARPKPPLIGIARTLGVSEAALAARLAGREPAAADYDEAPTV